jgi:superfamily I DNA/RNA helicase
MEWSSQQRAIFNAFAENGNTPRKNKVISALAGTGKTTTIVEGGRYAPEERIVYCAFNKRIEQELNVRLPEVNPRAKSQTLHSAGFGFCRKAWTGLTMSKGYDRSDDLANQVCPSTTPDPIRRLVRDLSTKGREINPWARNMGELTDLMYKFDLLPDESWVASGWDEAFIEKKALEAMDLAAKVKPIKTGIDFSDMIYLPVRNNWLHHMHDLVVVDEAQDMNMAQLAIAQGMCAGRMIVVGDPNQAIYAFRGADSESIDRLTRELNAEVLGLTVTYRCGKRIVALAQEIVPHFEADPDNSEGEIQEIAADKVVLAAEGGDFILSRTNAPLVSYAMMLLRNQKRARIAGRDLGSGLKSLIRKFNARSVPELMKKITAWEERQVIRFAQAGKEDKIEETRDKAETLRVLLEGAKSVTEAENTIDALFTDDGLGQKSVITCSSVHKAKGLEADRVFVLKSTLRDYNQEERNIQYVAITRARKTLVWIV